MEEEAALIYGLEFQARALSSLQGNNDAVAFLVGTQSLMNENQVHYVEYDEYANQLNKVVFTHKVGEIWRLSCSTIDPLIFASCYNEQQNDGYSAQRVGIWRLPKSTARGATDGDDGSSSAQLEHVTTLDVSEKGSDVTNIIWEPSGAERFATLVDRHLVLWDCKDISTPRITASHTVEVKGHLQLSCLAWNPHQNCQNIAVAVDNSIHAIDIRSMSAAWQVDGAHAQQIRDISFNPNRQYYLVSGGDDCLVKFWDVRKPQKPLITLNHHSHWVWSVRYNPFHDQLVLSASSDARVILSRVASISSEEKKRTEETDETGVDDEGGSVEVEDVMLACYEEHEDSVYAAEWSDADPWLFASLSYDGRLVLNKVPKNEKYRILL